MQIGATTQYTLTMSGVELRNLRQILLSVDKNWSLIASQEDASGARIIEDNSAAFEMLDDLISLI